jgi:hypothetical protein
LASSTCSPSLGWTRTFRGGRVSRIASRSSRVRRSEWGDCGDCGEWGGGGRRGGRPSNLPKLCQSCNVRLSRSVATSTRTILRQRFPPPVPTSRPNATILSLFDLLLVYIKIIVNGRMGLWALGRRHCLPATPAFDIA